MFRRFYRMTFVVNDWHIIQVKPRLVNDLVAMKTCLHIYVFLCVDLYVDLYVDLSSTYKSNFTNLIYETIFKVLHS
jgi:hypothetical protein